MFYNNKNVKDNIKMPISHGERIFGRWEYLPYFLNKSVQVIQPDLGNAGGITETKRVCDLAYVFDIGVHSYLRFASAYASVSTDRGLSE